MKKAIICATIACATLSAHANNNILPVRTRDRITSANDALATAWSQRSYIGASYVSQEYELEKSGNKLADIEASLLGPVGGYSNNIYTLEFEIGGGSSKVTYPNNSSSNTDNDLTGLAANMGFRITEMFALTLGLDTLVTEDKAAEETSITNVNLGASFKLDNGLYLGFGLGSKRGEIDPLINSSYDASVGTFFFGAGYENWSETEGYQVEGFFKGNKEKIGDLNSNGNRLLLAKSSSFVVNALYAVDNLELEGSLSSEKTEITHSGNENETTTNEMSVGLEYLVNQNFYLNPKMSYSKAESKDKDSSPETDITKISTLSLALGFRNESIEANLEYGLQTGDHSKESTSKTEYDLSGHTLNVNFGYIF